MSRRDPDFERLGDLMETGGVLGSHRGAAGRPGPARRISELWSGVVGAEIAGNTEPLRLTKGRLIVACSSSTWAQTLHLMAEQMRAGLNEALGDEVVEEVVFRHAGWTRVAGPGRGAGSQGSSAGAQPTGGGPGSHGGRQPGLSEAQEQALAEVEQADIAPVIKERLLAAMRESFARGEQENGR